jgi:hypothetical protein
VGQPARVKAPDEQRILQSLAERAGTERLMAMLERSLDGDAHIERRVQLVLVLEALADGLGRKLSE